MIYIELIVTFMFIGLFTVGGGYAALALVREQIVGSLGWMTMLEYSDLITLAEITPGPIAINSATFAGMKVAGFPGAVLATLGFITPPFIVVSILYFIYKKYRTLDIMQGIFSGLRPAVTALIAYAGLSIFILALWGGAPVSFAGLDLLAALLALAAFIVLRKWKITPIFVIFGCGAVSLAVEVVKTLRG